MRDKNRFAYYMNQYIRMITANKDEFFFAITDIEQEVLQSVLTVYTQIEDIYLATVSKKDYSKAVILRNRIEIRKIVLMAENSIKSIDSLKDFIEYPVIPEEDNIFEACINAAFEIVLTKEQLKFLKNLIIHRNISLTELFSYIEDSFSGDSLNNRNLKSNLAQLGLWKSKDDSLNIQGLKKIISCSDYHEIEKKLLPVISSGKIYIAEAKKKKLENIIVQRLYSELFKLLYFEEVKAIFTKGTHGVTRAETPEEEAEQYSFSYEMLLKEPDVVETIEELENMILNECTSGKSMNVGDNFLLAWSKYKIGISYIKIQEKRLHDLTGLTKLVHFSDKEKKDFSELFDGFKREWKNVVPSLVNQILNPCLLKQYCITMRPFTQAYFKLLSRLCTDEIWMEAFSETDFLERFQTLFCKVQKNRAVTLLYFHPLMCCYYMNIQNRYEEVIHNISANSSIEIRNMLSVILDTERKRFPIRNLIHKKEIYSLDYSQISEEYGEIDFKITNKNYAGSYMDMSTLSKYIIRFVEENPLLAQINVYIVDLVRLNGIQILYNRLLKVIHKSNILLNKIDIYILSETEHRMQEELEQNYTSLFVNPGIQFHFVRYRYIKQDGYQIKRIMERADLLIFADSSSIYQKPTLTRNFSDSNAIFERISDFSLETELSMMGLNRKSAISVMWDTVHNQILNRHKELSIWSNQQIDTSFLRTVDNVMNYNQFLKVVVITSNRNLDYTFAFHNVFQNQYWEKSFGKDILALEYSSGENKIYVEDAGNDIIWLSISELDFFWGDNEDFVFDKLYLGIDLKAMSFKGMYYIKENEKFEETAKVLLTELLEQAFVKQGYIANSIRIMLFDNWFKNAYSYEQLLGLYALQNNKRFIWNGELPVIPYKDNMELIDHSTEVIEFRKIMEFLQSFENLDRSTELKFRMNFDLSILEKIVKCEKQYHKLEENFSERIKLMYDHVK